MKTQSEKSIFSSSVGVVIAFAGRCTLGQIKLYCIHNKLYCTSYFFPWLRVLYYQTILHLIVTDNYDGIHNSLHLKVIVHLKMKILSSFTHPQVVSKLYELYVFILLNTK